MRLARTRFVRRALARPSTELSLAQAIGTAWRQEEGDILAFLPGVREIDRTRERLEARLPAALILPLHGQVDPAGQRAAIKRDPGGRRRVVLATAIAETSLTLPGVRVVIDPGTVKVAPLHPPLIASHLHLIASHLV